MTTENDGNEAILCSECFDYLECERIIAFVTQATCARCERTCLGYQTDISVEAIPQ